MCIIDMTNDICIMTSDDARDFLRAHGLDGYQIDEFGDMLKADDYLDLEYRHEGLKHEFECYERALDAAQGVLNDVMNLCMELKDRQRGAQAQRALQQIHDLVYNSEAV